MPQVADAHFHTRSLVLALLAAAGTCAATLLISGFLRGGSRISFVVGLLAFVLYFVAALAITVVLGIPAILALRAHKLVRWWSVLLTGAAIGAAVGWSTPEGQVPEIDFWPWTCAGLLASQAFWSVWRWSERADAA